MTKKPFDLLAAIAKKAETQEEQRKKPQAQIVYAAAFPGVFSFHLIQGPDLTARFPYVIIGETNHSALGVSKSEMFFETRVEARENFHDCIEVAVNELRNAGEVTDEQMQEMMTKIRVHMTVADEKTVSEKSEPYVQVIPFKYDRLN